MKDLTWLLLFIGFVWTVCVLVLIAGMWWILPLVLSVMFVFVRALGRGEM